jgi:hypothetical protein
VSLEFSILIEGGSNNSNTCRVQVGSVRTSACEDKEDVWTKGVVKKKVESWG